MNKDYLCAYHPTQLITNFCKCSECLLPVCPICVRLHSEEHFLLHTQPNYDLISDTVKHVRNNLAQFDMQSKKLGNKLIQIEEVRKQNEFMIKKKISEHKKKLIREFERCITKMEEDIIHIIVRSDEEFIDCLEAIDDKIIGFERKLQRQKVELEGNNCLKTIIDFHSNEKRETIQKTLSEIDNEIENLTKKTLYVCFDEGYFDELQKIVKGYINIRTMNWEEQ